MKKLILAFAIVLGSFITTNINAQKVDKIDPVEAISKGIETTPTPKILAWISENGLDAVYANLGQYVNWYMYKGNIYASYVIHPGSNPYSLPEGHLVVVFNPKGEVVDTFFNNVRVV